MKNGINSDTQFEKVRNVILILTHNCNLNCSYCYEHNKNKDIINLDLAKEIIQEEMNSNDDYKLEIEFFGGEPFLEFSLIEELYNYLESQKWSKDWLVTITTNGVLVHNEVKQWIENHQEKVKVALSADGTKNMHNLNRSNSYDLIDFDFFAKTNSVVKMTVSAETLNELSKGIISLHKKGFKTVRANLAFGIDWSKEENLAIYSRELKKLADYYIENPQLRPSDILELPIIDLNPSQSQYLSRHCGAGNELIAYEIDGISYPCHTFAPISVGLKTAQKARTLSFDKKINLTSFDKKCQNCIVASICPNCYGINFSMTGDMYLKDSDYCKMLKIQFLANAYFKYQQYINKQLELNTEEEFRLLNNIQLIQKLKI